MTFEELGLSRDLLDAIVNAGYTKPTPIQEQAIPHLLMGRDLLGIAQTGTGKTAGFTLPMIEILNAGRARARMPRSLILEPTRELAAQVAENFNVYGKNHKLSMALLIGGVSFIEQNEKLNRGVDVLIATPGRLIDQFERGRILLADIKILVVDEADRMLDMGFIPDVEKIMKLLPPLRQTAMFSATMPKEIKRLTESYMMDPKKIEVAPGASAAETVTQKLVMVNGVKEKQSTLEYLIKHNTVKNAIVFCNRKRDVKSVDQILRRKGVNARALHGDLPQSVRTSTLNEFREGKINILVASDVAARGLDIDDMSHVFNFDVPTHADDYIHRIGRTGRAGRTGYAYTIATADDSKYIKQIEKLIGNKIENFEDKNISKNKKEETNKNTLETNFSDQNKPSKNSKRKPQTNTNVSLETNNKGSQLNNNSKNKKQPNNKKQQNEGNDNLEIGMGDHIPDFLNR
jgi:superfamily II DNA/RNA helicase